MWTINWIYQLEALIPSFLRKPIRLAWLDLLLWGLKQTQLAFAAYRGDANRRATYTGQVMVLERMLNLHYYGIDFLFASPGDITAGGHIYIENTAAQMSSNYIWFNSEVQEPTYIYFDDGNPSEVPLIDQEPLLFAYNQVEFFNQIAFKVKVPNALSFDMGDMRARIDKYAIAGFNYTIETY